MAIVQECCYETYKRFFVIIMGVIRSNNNLSFFMAILRVNTSGALTFIGIGRAIVVRL